MKGASELISGILLIIITIITISVSFYFYHTTIYKSGEEIEEGSEGIYYSQSSNFVILDVNGKNITIWNNGGTKLNLDKFRVYVNGENRTINHIEESGTSTGILELGENIIIILENSTFTNDNVRVIGEYETGDRVIVE